MKKTVIFMRIVTVLLLFFTLSIGVALIFVHDEVMKLIQYTHYLVIVIPMILFIPLTIFHFSQTAKIGSENGSKESDGKTYLTKCGHQSKLEDQITAFGETITTTMALDNGQLEYCHKCLEKMAVKCAWCEKPIFIGDHITLYSPSKPNFKIPEGAVIYKQDPLTLVGCGRRDCADTGADYCGTWMPPGQVKRFASLIETALANPRHAVTSNEIGNPNATKLIPLDKEEK